MNEYFQNDLIQFFLQTNNQDLVDPDALAVLDATLHFKTKSSILHFFFRTGTRGTIYKRSRLSVFV